jgi:hypothetical protein
LRIVVERAVQDTGLIPLEFCLWGWTKSEVYKRQVDKPNELFASILGVATHIKESEGKLRRKNAVFPYELRSELRLMWGFQTLIVNCNKFVI